MYDFASSSYTTVVLTTIYNAYFVGVIATANGAGNGGATLLWTLAVGVSNALVLFSAPLIGGIADTGACKKRLLAASTFGCVLFTAALALPGPAHIGWAMAFLILSNFMFATGENLIAAFLPEIAPAKDMGRVSGYGWSLGYIGGLFVLALCLAYVSWAQAAGHDERQFVPVSMLIVAACFGLAAIPTLLWLRERAQATPRPEGRGYVGAGFARIRETISHLHHYRDLVRFMLTLTVFYCGIHTVVVLAAVYAREVMGFSYSEIIQLILVVNFTAAIGAFAFGHLQDRLGSIRVLFLTLVLWVAAIALAWATQGGAMFWLAANMIGVAMGSSQSAGRALIGLFSPAGRFAEFFGFWGLAVKLAAIIGPMSYGAIAYLSGGDHRLALLSTLAFFVAGMLLLLSVDEKRGRAAALTPNGD